MGHRHEFVVQGEDLRRARSSTLRTSRIVQAVHALLTCDYSG
ncbi:hypothetical protein [Streptomyces sp. NPDC016845]